MLRMGEPSFQALGRTGDGVTKLGREGKKISKVEIRLGRKRLLRSKAGFCKKDANELEMPQDGFRSIRNLIARPVRGTGTDELKGEYRKRRVSCRWLSAEADKQMTAEETETNQSRSWTGMGEGEGEGGQKKERTKRSS
jgi:hypothetical protein